jgi:hypothetical protein
MKTMTTDGLTVTVAWPSERGYAAERRARSERRRMAPKWKDIGAAAGMDGSHCHMIYYNYRGRRTYRENDPKVVKLLQVIQELGLPPRRRKRGSVTVGTLLAKHFA